ncbi:unnamed protein product, partial [marine sediment metagenome]
AWDGLDRDELYEAFAALPGEDTDAEKKEARKALDAMLSSETGSVYVPPAVAEELMVQHGTDTMQRIGGRIRKGDADYKFNSEGTQELSMGNPASYSAVGLGDPTKARIESLVSGYEGLLKAVEALKGEKAKAPAADAAQPAE